ncbi:hypothetical protein ARMSODRAFT_1025407 [Armillaria solidipes]|uniref:Uncharacterized protein n=1 Tax=Armillaria solidipes TaxID=1076256 RepID=A0A2H3ASY9_9AGAR|nr:hypothetical protein ARMSODRAFT_1025407 [Armillaria solidipes]
MSNTGLRIYSSLSVGLDIKAGRPHLWAVIFCVSGSGLRQDDVLRSDERDAEIRAIGWRSSHRRMVSLCARRIVVLGPFLPPADGRSAWVVMYGILVITSPSADNIHSPNFAPKTQGTTVNDNAGMSQKSLEAGWEDHR